MRATAAPFATMDGKASVAIALGFIASSALMNADTLDLVARTTSQINGETKTYRQSFRFRDQTTAAGQRIELLAKLPMPPGRYDIRLGVSDGEKESSGVYAPVEVPEFSKEDLAMSGLVLAEAPSHGLPRGALTDLTPVAPTTRRAFRTTDHVSAFVRAYQKEDRTPPTATVSLLDAAGQPMIQTSAALSSALFGRLRASDCSFDLPLGRLAPGLYLLTVELKSGKTTATRSTSFTVE
jgi:hypothetical protein